MFHKKSKIDNRSRRRRVALLAVIFISTLVAPDAPAQKAAKRKPKTRSAIATQQSSQEDAKKLAEAAKESRANLISASNAYRASLEALLELQRQDESRAAETVEKRKGL